MSLLGDITSRYSAAEAFLYDRLVAPAVEAQWGVLSAAIDAALPRGGSLLDVGAGGGQNALRVARLRPDARVVGVDLSPEQVRRARARAARAGVEARFVEGNALDLPFGSEHDVVMSIASIKHWPDRRRGLEECVRVLAEGGTLLIVEADRGCRLEDARAFVRAWRLPAAARLVAVPLFRTYVAGQAIDLEDARALVAGLPLTEVRVERLAGLPALSISGRRA